MPTQSARRALLSDAESARFEALRRRLHWPSSDALMTLLAIEGLNAIESRLTEPNRPEG